MGAMTRTERLWRLKQESKARSPYTCPACSSGAIRPMFWPRLGLLWGCVVCGHIFSEAD
jgi:ribosomal protein L37AE/L43A